MSKRSKRLPPGGKEAYKKMFHITKVTFKTLTTQNAREGVEDKSSPLLLWGNASYSLWSIRFA